MNAAVCEECLTRDGVVIVAFEGEACRRCGYVPVRGALTPGEIRECIKERVRREKR